MLKVHAHHLSFPVRDLKQSQDFYGNVLGLEEIPRPNFPFPGAWYQAGDIQVHLIVPPEGVEVGPAPPALNPTDQHAAFAIADYTEAVEYLQSKRLEIFETAPEIGQMWIRDPDGYISELIVDATLAQRLASEGKTT